MSRFLGPRYLLVLAALLAGCSNVSVTTDYEPTTDFSKYRTYAWAPDPPVKEQPGPSIAAAIHQAVDAALERKGFRVSASPSLRVFTRFAAKQQVAVHRTTEWDSHVSHPRTRRGLGYYGAWPGLPRTITDFEQFTEGTVLLDFVDARTQRLVWRGEGAMIVGRPEENVRSATEAVVRMLELFPPSETLR